MEPPAESSARIGRTHGNTTQQRYDLQNSQMLSKNSGSGRLKKPKEEEDLSNYFDLNDSISYSPTDDFNSFDDLPENFLDTEETPQSNHFKSFSADNIRRNGNSFNNNTNYDKEPRYHRSGLTSSSKSSDLLTDLRHTDSFSQDNDLGTGFDTVSDRRNGLHQATYEIPPQGSSTYVSEINQVRGFDKEPISNVELASSMISTLEGDDSTSTIYDSYDDMPVPRHTQRIIPSRSIVAPPPKIETSEKVHEIRPPRPTYRPLKTVVTVKRDYNNSGYDDTPIRHVNEEVKTEAVQSSYDIEEDEMMIDTAELCRRIAFELKKYKIPQVLFAEKIIGRSQGTLSDLLRNPKPWDQLKTGKSTFKKMFDWVNLNQDDRLSVLGMDGNGNKVSTPRSESLLDPPSPAPNARHSGKTKKYSGEEGPAIKKPRLIFSDVQKRTLQAIFKETERPSKEMQQTIAEHLGLDPSTVSNYFMNARRRSRNTQIQLDSYTDSNDGNPITPPPETPSRRNSNKRSTSNRKKEDELGIGDTPIKTEIDEISEASM
uniref:One cut domain family member n=1 Tax=Strongyloides stercoralis TaxID=6248 RepID=A0A0K0EQ93_STRER